MNNLSKFGVQELSIKDIQTVEGGNILEDWLIGKAIDLTVGAFIDYCNSGKVYGSFMDRHAKL